MSDLPISFSSDSRDWAAFTLAALASRLENADSESGRVEAHWDDPEDPQWSILLAQQLLDQLKSGRLEWDAGGKQTAVVEQFLHHLLRWLRQAGQAALASDEGALQRLVLIQQVALLYSALLGKGLQRVEGHLLQLLFASGHVTAMQLGIDYLLTQPPSNWTDVSLALSPLVQSKDWPVEVVYPKLLTSETPSVLAPALDVANHYFRTQKPKQHPAEPEFQRLVTLLGGLANQLGMLEENPRRFGDSVAKIQRILFDSVSLAVSLCDTLGLIGNPEAIGKLNQALRLSHRRIQTEAAFALAKLGDKHGKQKMLELASDFTCRQRAVAYAEELGIENELDEQWTTNRALAESRLANWLAQNEQMGIAPARLELIEQRTLYWPGFDQPQECFLFRFEYDMQDSVYSNLGFSGPMCHCFADDLANIAIEDAFAMFAGYDIDHPDVYELPPQAWNAAERSRVQPWLAELQKRYDSLDVLFLGVFLEHQAILCRSQKGSEQRVFVFDGEHSTFEPFPQPGHADPKLTYLLWRGRLFLETSEYSADSVD